MTLSMTELMRTVRNAFVTGAAEGSWRMADGALSGEIPLRPGWIALDGLGAFLLDEAGRAEGLPDALPPDGFYEGTVWLLDPPADFTRLLEEINAWLAAHGSEAVTAGTVTRRRESFGAYSTETEYGAGASGSWEAAFAGRLAPYRRMFAEVRL